MRDELPAARYLVLASRLIPDLDGGFTISVLRRAADMAAAGAYVTLLTVDPGETADHDAHRAEWVRRGLLGSGESLRNLFDDARSDPSWLRRAAIPGPVPSSPWPTRAITDADGETVLELPIVSGDAAWHLTDAPVRVHDGGAVIGWLPGFGGLYRAWLNAVAAERTDGGAEVARTPVVVLCEARQIGETLVAAGEPALDAGIRVLHTTHACHVLSPFRWDSPMDAAWQRWFEIADRFDGVLWLTPSQRDDVERRFGAQRLRSFVVPHPAPVVSAPSDPVAGRIVILNSLIPRKRVDHVLRALPAVRAAVPAAHVCVYGDGASGAELRALAAELGIADAVEWIGHVADPATQAWASADVLVLASTNEGQPLVILEALAAGVPVVAYDMPYGPRDTLAHGGGVLVADGDIDALGAALIDVLSDRNRRAELSASGRAAAAAMDAAASMRALGTAVRAVLADPVSR
ncbi:glycosyltransferase family 4 protein [Microbacterium sp. NPDC076895]|uniref:glycosyltransferase family 4 protein n=1 Tax=Microbacterium sp. NPDC076895 TaxID=3154957 RepID=UPI003422879B